MLGIVFNCYVSSFSCCLHLYLFSPSNLPKFVSLIFFKRITIFKSSLFFLTFSSFLLLCFRIALLLFSHHLDKMLRSVCFLSLVVLNVFKAYFLLCALPVILQIYSVFFLVILFNYLKFSYHCLLSCTVRNQALILP